ncbi:DUF2249 domain-containing protein [Rhodoblastus sp.]|uniref:DUF2249 domain-containing protein n=1 Tax=Rhodoblastus sp. TaxID=1962975 RepID=UPI0025E54189|nr:DUF2249 domain-containing protein [Rhodoblastus sp.]
MLNRDRNERVIKVADIDPRYRHTVIFQLFEHLEPDQSFQLVVDHDPKPLRLQLEAHHAGRCDWTYLEVGPDVWRVRLRLLRCRSGRSCGSNQRSTATRPQPA